MNQYQKTLSCQYCGKYLGFILYEDICEINITDIQCRECEVKESSLKDNK